MKYRNIFMVSVLLLVGMAVQAADTLRVGPMINYPYAVVNSATSGNTNVASNWATNGAFPKSIATTSGVGVTNCIVIPVVGDKVTVGFSAISPGGTGTGVLVLKHSVMPPALGYVSTAGAYGAGGYTNANPMRPFATITLVTGTSQTVTNVSFCPQANAFANEGGSTAVLGATPYLILESIGTTGYALSNYSVWVNQR